MTQDPDAKAALAAIHSARAGVTDQTSYSVVYDLMYGAICGLLVASQGLELPWSAVSLVVAMAGLAYAVSWWKQRYGWWVNGYSPRRARWVAVALTTVLIGLMCVSIWGRYAGIVWMPLATAAAGFVAAVVGGRLWMWVWKRELQTGPQ